MLILGLLLVIASAAAAVLLVAYNSSGGPEQTIDLFGRDLVSVTPLQAFLTGIVIALVFCIGLWMVVTTERRRRMARDQWRDARREARAAHREAQAAARERDELAEQLVRERENAAATTTVIPEQERSSVRRRPAHAADEQPAPAADPAADDAARARGISIARHFRRRRTENATAASDQQQTPR
jgi:ABC-type nickel/cobalt efflux system permease component RcnA